MQKLGFYLAKPLLGPLDDLNLTKIHWVIVGGESGPGARPMEADWVRSIRDQCKTQKVAFFFKQWGGVQKHRYGRELDNRTYDEYPMKSLLIKVRISFYPFGVPLLQIQLSKLNYKKP
ncbi:DUF5131 family protein [Peribacillus frigoritolerans]|nr:DUF5131 family protein [Peribacillus frigoritolerans]